MAARAERFADNVTLNALKEKLGQLGLPTAGNKATLKSRLLENLQHLSEDNLGQFFPESVLLPSDDGHEGTNVSTSENNSGQDTPGINMMTSENNPSGNGNEDETLNIELETLRSKLEKKRQIVELKRQLSALTVEENLELTNPRSMVNFRDVEESLISFSGDDSYSIQRWLQQFEESAEILGWDSRMTLIYAKRLMRGTARHFLRTAPFSSWSSLKAALIREFSQKVTSAEIHNQLRNRKRKRDETLQQYVFSMQELASLTNVEEGDLMEYIISGIPDSTVNKMLLFGADTIDELK